MTIDGIPTGYYEVEPNGKMTKVFDTDTHPTNEQKPVAAAVQPALTGRRETVSPIQPVSRQRRITLHLRG